jgi:hypothetical protein
LLLQKNATTPPSSTYLKHNQHHDQQTQNLTL